MQSESSPSSPNQRSHGSSTEVGTASTQDFHVRDPPPDEQPKVGQSPLRPRRGTRSSEELRTTNPPRLSGTGTSPPSGKITSSSVSGIASRKREKPLPDINVEGISDPVAKKQARNTRAARNCRERKMKLVRELEERVSRLVEERDRWKSIALEGIRDNNG